VIVTTPRVSADEIERRTGWKLRPEGLCREDVCVPVAFEGEEVDVAVLSDALRMPVVADDAHGLWCLGPPASGHALETAVAPELELPDLDGNVFKLSSLRGQKVLLVAWASW
jgi:hypothetical protein